MKNQEFALFIWHNRLLSEMQSFVGEKVNANHGEAAKPFSLDLLPSRIHREISTRQHFQTTFSARWEPRRNKEAVIFTSQTCRNADIFLMDADFTKANILFPVVANN